MEWEAAQAPLAPQQDALGTAPAAPPDARLAVADGGGAVAHTPAPRADAAAPRRTSDGSGSAPAGVSAFLTPTAVPALKSSLKRSAPRSAPAGIAAADEAPSSLKRARGASALGARSVPRSVTFRRTAITLGRAEAAVDRTPHDMPNSCDVCGEYCILGRWSCLQCAQGVDDEYDICVRCYTTAATLAPSLWPHAHARAAFALMDASPEEDAEDEADSAARAAAEADGFFPTAGSPRQLAPVFAAQKQASPGIVVPMHEDAGAEGDESPQRALLASPAVDALQAPMSEHKLSK